MSKFHNRRDNDKRGNRSSGSGKRNYGRKPADLKREGRDPKDYRSRDSRDTRDLRDTRGFDNQKEKSITNLVFGKNSIIECLDQSPDKISKIWLAQGSDNAKLKDIETAARKAKIPVIKVERRALDKISQGEDHRSAIAEISPIKVYDEEYLYENADKLKTLLMPVNIEDPHNLGAIIRTAHAFNVDAIVINSRKSAPVTATVVSTSAGAAFKMKIIRAGNLSNVIRNLKKKGFWIYGTSVNAENATPIDKIKFDARTVLLVGNEGKGLGDLLAKQCDFSVYIPMKFESLNVSVATGILLNKIYQDAGV